jgi:hypothetical protein
MPKTHTIGDEQKKQFAGAYLLEKMINHRLSIPIFLDGNDEDLEPVLEYLMAKGYAEIKNNENYIPTEKGREVLKRFLQRYHDYLKHFDIYCAVDLGQGTFAFADYFEYDHLESTGAGEWRRFLSEDRWEDLRVAVAEFKKLDPVEIVFMSFLNEGRFGETPEGWQFDLLLGSVWDEILEICSTALAVDDLGYEAEDGEKVSGEAVMQDVISQGAELALELRKREEQLYGGGGDEEDEEEEEEIVERVIVEDETYEVYESYYDPYYVSPCWGVVVFF